MLIGDSVTRYQYLSLAYFLATGLWTSRPSNTNEKEFLSWQHFFNVTNDRLGGRELCDCFRTGNPRDGAHESRFYEDDHVAVAFVPVVNPPLVKIHHFDYIRQCSPFCPHRPPNTTWAFDFDANRSPEQLLNLTKPYSYVFLNLGHWYAAQGVAKGVSAHFLSALSHAKNIHWKTTTFPGVRETAFVSMLSRVFDAHALTAALPQASLQTFMWDARHFTEEVYRGLNEALLGYICGGVSGW